jgi:hypothetical protein
MVPGTAELRFFDFAFKLRKKKSKNSNSVSFTHASSSSFVAVNQFYGSASYAEAYPFFLPVPVLNTGGSFVLFHRGIKKKN